MEVKISIVAQFVKFCNILEVKKSIVAQSVKFHKVSERNRYKKHKRGVFSKTGGINRSSNLGPFGTFWKLGCLRRKQLGGKLLHVLLKNGFGGFCNASVKFTKTLGKHISLNHTERITITFLSPSPSFHLNQVALGSMHGRFDR